MKEKLVVFEGIPGGGKTEVFERLKNLFEENVTFIPERVIPFDPLTENTIEAIFRNDLAKHQAAQQALPRMAIMDRNYISSLNWDYVLQRLKKPNKFVAKKLWVQERLKEGSISPPTYYLYFNLLETTSLYRKKLPVRDDLAWSTKESLELAKDFYQMYFQENSAESRVINIDAEQDLEVVVNLVSQHLLRIWEGQ